MHRTKNRLRQKGKLNFLVYSRTGFTFIELLLVTVMVSVVALAVYAMFSNGIKVWLSVNEEFPLADINIFFDKINQDLNNSFPYLKVPFTGKESELSFPCIVVQEDAVCQSVGKVEYYYDADAKTLNKKQITYSGIFSLTGTLPNVLVKNLESFSFKYYFYDPEKEQFFWADSWPLLAVDNMIETGEFPLAVRIELSIMKNNVSQKYVRIISFPCGGLLNR